LSDKKKLFPMSVGLYGLTSRVNTTEKAACQLASVPRVSNLQSKWWKSSQTCAEKHWRDL